MLGQFSFQSTLENTPRQFQFWPRSSLTDVLLCIKPDPQYNISCVQNRKQIKPSCLDTYTASCVSSHIGYTNGSLLTSDERDAKPDRYIAGNVAFLLKKREKNPKQTRKRAGFLVSEGACGKKPGLSDSGSVFATVLWVCSPCQKQQPNSITLNLPRYIGKIIHRIAERQNSGLDFVEAPTGASSSGVSSWT